MLPVGTMVVLNEPVRYYSLEGHLEYEISTNEIGFTTKCKINKIGAICIQFGNILHTHKSVNEIKMLSTLDYLCLLGVINKELDRRCRHGKWDPSLDPDEWCQYCDTGMSE